MTPSETGATEFLASLGPGYVLAAAIVLTLVRLSAVQTRTALARSVGELADSLLVAGVLVFLIVRPFLVQAFFIPTSSMEPTLAGHDAGDARTGEVYTDTAHDHLFVNRLVYRLRDPRRGEIAVFRAEKSADTEASSEGLPPQEHNLVKRVIGVPGDTVQIKPDDQGVMRVWLDKHDGKGLQPQTEPYIKWSSTPSRAMDNPQPDEAKNATHGPLTLGPGRYFMMGDNRNHSSDSRFWGTVPRDRFIGKALFTFWPLNRVGVPR